jgi:hypothetical protein
MTWSATENAARRGSGVTASAWVSPSASASAEHDGYVTENSQHEFGFLETGGRGSGTS